jgi:PAS domain S-box-containing protein
MGSPLIVKNEIIGVVAVQSYLNENLYAEQDLRLLSIASDQISIVIDRKRTEEELRENEKKYKQLFQNAPVGIYEINFEKVRFETVNDIMCKYSGYSEKEFLSMNPLDLLTEESKKLYLERFEKLSPKEDLSLNVEYTIIKKNGQELCVTLNSDYIYKNGKLTGSRVVVQDITKIKQAQEEKINAQKIAGEQKKLALVGQVAGKMAHDFNNILGIIMGNTELSLMDCKDAEIKETLELIFEQTIRGKNLTRNLVAFAKAQEPRQEFFRISDKIDLVLNLLKKDLKGIELIKEDKAGVPDLLADPGMIEHALVNLIQNSIHAVSLVEHPRIINRIYSLDDNICIEIEDNGCGIFKKHFKNIFEPSFTLKGSKDTTGSYGREIKGTGYGMANVKKYIEQHKGSISIESEFGSGTKFTINLPIIKKELTNQEKLEIQKEKISFDKSILLVEDESAISGVQYRILSQEPCNHKVDIANDGQVAMDLFKRNNYDLISLDYVLPGGINGMDVYSYIRETDKIIPILFISGNIEFLESIKELKLKDGNIDHLSKPCQNKDYVKSINDLFAMNLASQE